MIDAKLRYEVVIIGGGPAGLFLAIDLLQRGIRCIVLEKRTERTTHSKSLGIHPVSLELMGQLGIVKPFLEEGIKIRQGAAWHDSGKIGTLSFDNCPGPYPFVLSLPQYRTEYLLEKALEKLDPNCLKRGIELVDLEQHNSCVTIRVNEAGETRELTPKILVGCDGKDSKVRKAAGFQFNGSSYPDTYVMGDFEDDTDLGTSAAIFLHSQGLIESFPLLENRRRWVVKTDQYHDNPDRTLIETLVNNRIGFSLYESDNFMLSSFGVQRYLAQPMAENRIFLAGDSAHIVSPIGGQGMNLGWLDCAELAPNIEEVLQNEHRVKTVASSYSRSRRRVARKVIKRAEINMALGRKSKLYPLKKKLVRLMLNTPLEQLMARIFTMRGLKRWPV